MAPTRLYTAGLVLLVLGLGKSSFAQTESNIISTHFDVTKYGAVADEKTENSQAFLKAWNATCSYNGNATFLVPKGTFLLGPISLKGPCYNNTWTGIRIEGTLKALPNLQDFQSIGWIEFNKLHELVVGGGGTLDGQGAQSWSLSTCKKQKKCKNLPTSLRINEVNNATISSITLVDSKGFHVNFHKCANIETRFLKITAPGNSPNTDGIHISGTSNINVTHMDISTGDDCISIGPGASNVKIANITCGPGHGISIGSLGKFSNEEDVVGVKVRNCTLKGTTNGLRIKTWPGSPPSKANNITFEDILLHNVSNPIIIDQEYCPVHHCTPEPSQVKIADVYFKKIQGTSNTATAVKLFCSKSVPCQGIKLEDIDIKDINNATVPLSNCTNLVQSLFAGLQYPPPCIPSSLNLTAVKDKINDTLHDMMMKH